MEIQKEMRVKNFPLLERLERMNQKEHEFENKDIAPVLPILRGKMVNTIEPIEPVTTRKFFTKLNLLNNKRRFR
jgi:hypothetical protein